jgi:tripartite-type tricarboxylate transporter receptor subunit TctC
VRAGKLRAIAMAGTKRSNLLPELPTIPEAGFRYDTRGWYG